ncbi:MAG: hypothetical protein IJS08_10145, partial [Victivallales bacterium]|nr:hypothetical protein [Victivallales bacterium]
MQKDIPEPVGEAASQLGMVKCPQCGKMVSKAFPFCEFCTFPIGEMLQRGSSSEFIAEKLKEEKERNAQKRCGSFDYHKATRRGVMALLVVSVALAI